MKSVHPSTGSGRTDAASKRLLLPFVMRSGIAAIYFNTFVVSLSNHGKLLFNVI